MDNNAALHSVYQIKELLMPTQIYMKGVEYYCVVCFIIKHFKKNRVTQYIFI